MSPQLSRLHIPSISGKLKIRSSKFPFEPVKNASKIFAKSIGFAEKKEKGKDN